METQPPDDAEAASPTIHIQATEAAYTGWKSLMSSSTSRNNNKNWSRGPCTACTDLLWRILIAPNINPHSNDWYRPRVGHWETYVQLTRSCRTCDLCALIKRAILTSPKSTSYPRSNDDSYFAGPGSWHEFAEAGNGVKHLSVSQMSRSPRFLRVFTEADDLMAGVVPGRVVLERSGDHFQLLMAKGWIDECVERHAECRRVVSSSPEPELPTRVIEIGAGTLRLLQTNGQRGKWAALSHRWGTMSWKDKVFNRKSPIMTLLSTNNERLQQSIDPEHLTKTFQDAITVTHTLGLRYLWIDSLCIIQDSIEDWERESNLMADVYSHAQVTISAAAGPKGIFCEREWAKSSNPVKYQIFTGAGVGTIMFDIEHVNKRTPDPDLNYLQSRAWCFQEARLSPRLLAFDQAQMSLTCLQGRREEAIEPSGRDGRKKRNDFMLEYGDAEHPRKSKQDILEMWYNLVEDYSARNLTVASDKLVAISSVAKVINTHLADDYMAGMWKNSPPQGLLWRPDKRDDTFNERAFPSTTLRPYRAPSWSWASVEGRVAFFFARNALEETTIASIVNLHCDNDGKDKYGPCRNGHLEIRGPLKPAFTGERNLWIASHIGLYRPNTTGKGDAKEEFAFCMLDATPGLKQGSDIWCFQISTGHGLVLQKTSNSPEEYKRIGIFTQDTERRATPENLRWWAEGGHSTIKIV